MKIYSSLVLLSLTALALGRLSVNDVACNNYLQKFGTAVQANGQGATQLAFSGDASFVGTSADVQVNLRYSDTLHYNDQYYGLVQEDGKTADETCLDLKLYKYQSDTYTGEVQVTDLPITNSTNFQKKWRYLSFTIKGAELKTRLVEQSNSENYVYNGYYAIKYFAAGTDQLQYTFFFQFTVTVNRGTGAAVDTAFHPISYSEGLSCGTGSCTIKTLTNLQWCQDTTCSQTINAPDLYLNDQFILKQTIVTEGLKSYYLSNAVIYYKGEGLYKKATITSANYATAGQAIYLLNAEIAWRAVTIQVQAYLSNVAPTGRLLAEAQPESTGLDPVTGVTDQLTCIKVSKDSDTCATCDEMCSANNGVAPSDCTECKSNSLMLSMLALMFLMFAF